MSQPTKVKRPSSISVGDFFSQNAKALKLRLVGSDVGFSRKIWEPSVNRPGLALSGFFTYFAYKRIQIIGNSELSCLEGMEPKLRAARFSQLCSWEIPTSSSHAVTALRMSWCRSPMRLVSRCFRRA
jgi:HPr kinase/phosphorylase